MRKPVEKQSHRIFTEVRGENQETKALLLRSGGRERERRRRNFGTLLKISQWHL